VPTFTWPEDWSPCELSRWAIAGAVVIGIHAVAVAYVLVTHQPDKIGAVSDVVTVELTSIDSTPNALESEVAPAPETMVESQPLPDLPTENQADEVTMEQPPDETPALVPTPVVRPPSRSKIRRHRPHRRRSRSKAALRRIEPSWRTSLVRQLQRFKRYPAAAQSRNEQGVVLLRFSRDRSGHVLARSITRSSGHADLAGRRAVYCTVLPARHSILSLYPIDFGKSVPGPTNSSKDIPMRQTVVVAMLFVFGAGGALAADLELPTSLPMPPSSYYPVMQPVNWSGVYFGVNGGYAIGVSDWGNAGASTGDFNTKGALVGATLGINYTDGLAGFLIGAEGDFDWSWLNGSSSIAACVGIGAPAGTACATKSNWLSTGRGRVGYTFRNFLIFGTAGVASSDFQVGLQPGGVQSVTGPQLGWTAGGGIEYAFADYLTAKLEYLFVDFGTISCPASTGCGDLTTASISRTESVIRGGINYKITW
jgi:outer membrane immunogenic protein